MTRIATIIILLTFLTISSCDPVYFYSIQKSGTEYERYPTFDFDFAEIEISAECFPRSLVRPNVLLTIRPRVTLRMSIDQFVVIVAGDTSGVDLSERWTNDPLKDGIFQPGSEVHFAVKPTSDDPTFLCPEQMEFIVNVVVDRRDTVVSRFHLRRDDFDVQ